MTIIRATDIVMTTASINVSEEEEVASVDDVTLPTAETADNQSKHTAKWLSVMFMCISRRACDTSKKTAKIINSDIT